jgi:membrane protein implicated in regulation of membrane protease activity
MVVAAIFVIGEVFTAGFFLLWFGVGAAVAGIVSFVGLGIGWQLGAFVLTAAVLFLVSRRFAERLTRRQPPGIGADRFVGMRGVVLEEIDNLKNTGRVRVQKDEWRADSETGDVVPEGQLIEVTRVDGAHLIVRPVGEGE